MCSSDSDTSFRHGDTCFVRELSESSSTASLSDGRNNWQLLRILKASTQHPLVGTGSTSAVCGLSVGENSFTIGYRHAAVPARTVDPADANYTVIAP